MLIPLHVEQIFKSGRVSGLVFLLILAISTAYFIRRGKTGKVPFIRRVAGLDAIDEAVGRATEMGRPVFCSHGIASISDATYGPQTIAGLSVLGYVAQLCAKYGTRLIVPIRMVTVYPIAREIVENAYRAEGKLDQFRAEDLVYLSGWQFGYSLGYMSLMQREKAGANIMIGGYWAESLQLAEVGYMVGAMQVSGTANIHQIPFFVVATDYCLIGEEIFAAGAYLSKDPAMIGSIVAQDIGKFISVALVVISFVLLLGGNRFIVDLLRW
ncbi:MAG: hypothetical protein N3E39_00440 [Candidatus Methanomethylicia archaeon]|nr:hypothetical protein [Candidatus Methanomethylicia archaeon]